MNHEESAINPHSEAGQGLVEYSMILSAVAFVSVAVVTTLGAKILGLPGWNLF